MPNAIKSGAADELIYQIETNNMQWTTNGNIDLSTETERLGGGSVIGKRFLLLLLLLAIFIYIVDLKTDEVAIILNLCVTLSFGSLTAVCRLIFLSD